MCLLWKIFLYVFVVAVQLSYFRPFPYYILFVISVYTPDAVKIVFYQNIRQKCNSYHSKFAVIICNLTMNEV